MKRWWIRISDESQHENKNMKPAKWNKFQSGAESVRLQVTSERSSLGSFKVRICFLKLFLAFIRRVHRDRDRDRERMQQRPMAMVELGSLQQGLSIPTWAARCTEGATRRSNNSGFVQTISMPSLIYWAVFADALSCQWRWTDMTSPSRTF